MTDTTNQNSAQEQEIVIASDVDAVATVEAEVAAMEMDGSLVMDALLEELAEVEPSDGADVVVENTGAKFSQYDVAFNDFLLRDVKVDLADPLDAAGFDLGDVDDLNGGDIFADLGDLVETPIDGPEFDPRPRPRPPFDKGGDDGVVPTPPDNGGGDGFVPTPPPYNGPEWPVIKFPDVKPPVDVDPVDPEPTPVDPIVDPVDPEPTPIDVEAPVVPPEEPEKPEQPQPQPQPPEEPEPEPGQPEPEPGPTPFPPPGPNPRPGPGPKPKPKPKPKPAPDDDEKDPDDGVGTVLPGAGPNDDGTPADDNGGIGQLPGENGGFPGGLGDPDGNGIIEDHQPPGTPIDPDKFPGFPIDDDDNGNGEAIGELPGGGFPGGIGDPDGNGIIGDEDQQGGPIDGDELPGFPIDDDDNGNGEAIGELPGGGFPGGIGDPDGNGIIGDEDNKGPIDGDELPSDGFPIDDDDKGNGEGIGELPGQGGGGIDEIIGGEGKNPIDELPEGFPIGVIGDEEEAPADSEGQVAGEGNADGEGDIADEGGSASGDDGVDESIGGAVDGDIHDDVSETPVVSEEDETTGEEPAETVGAVEEPVAEETPVVSDEDETTGEEPAETVGAVEEPVAEEPVAEEPVAEEKPVVVEEPKADEGLEDETVVADAQEGSVDDSDELEGYEAGVAGGGVEEDTAVVATEEEPTVETPVFEKTPVVSEEPVVVADAPVVEETPIVTEDETVIADAPVVEETPVVSEEPKAEGTLEDETVIADGSDETVVADDASDLDGHKPGLFGKGEEDTTTEDTSSIDDAVVADAPEDAEPAGVVVEEKPSEETEEVVLADDADATMENVDADLSSDEMNDDFNSFITDVDSPFDAAEDVDAGIIDGSLVMEDVVLGEEHLPGLEVGEVQTPVGFEMPKDGMEFMDGFGGVGEATFGHMIAETPEDTSTLI